MAFFACSWASDVGRPLSIILTLALGYADGVRAQTAPSWVGRTVVAKSGEFVLRHGDQVRERLITKTFFYLVKSADGPTLVLEGPRGTGWALADQVVASDKAEEYFTEQIGQKPNAFFYVLRGVVRVEHKKVGLALADFAEAIRLELRETSRFAGARFVHWGPSTM